MTRLASFAAALIVAAPLASFAAEDMQPKPGIEKQMQNMHEQMHGDMPKDGKSDMSTMSDADKAFADARQKMHEAMMSMKPTGDPDVDFAQRMIPHHQGAIDMAKVVLKYGKDPDIKKLADDIVKTQESEIVVLKGWVEKHK